MMHAEDKDPNGTAEQETLSKQRCVSGEKCQKLKSICWALFLGQVLAVLFGASVTFLALLAADNFTLPFAEMTPQYLLVAIVFGFARLWLCCRSRSSSSSSSTHPLIVSGSGDEERRPGTVKKLLLFSITGITDMYSHCTTLYSFAYTNITSVQILDCATVPASMLFSFLILHRRYSWPHYVGAVICVLGSSMTVLADVLATDTQIMNQHQDGQNGTTLYDVLFGDVLAITGAVIYGLSSVLQEHCVITCGPTAYLSSGPLIAAIVSAVFCGGLEHPQLTELVTHSTIGGKRVSSNAIYYFLGYALVMSTLDMVIGLTIVNLSAVLINLSVLTADVYALLVGIFVFNLRFHFLYFIAFVLIVVGTVLFGIRSAKADKSD